jgi:hypothetical protein
MNRALIALTTLGATALVAGSLTGAAAQLINLSGQFQCVKDCAAPPPALAYVTQENAQLNLVNEAGAPSRAWIDYPGHIWAEAWNEGAIYSPDGMTIQFDRGSVWKRVVAAPPPPPPPPPPPRRRVHHYYHKPYYRPPPPPNS